MTGRIPRWFVRLVVYLRSPKFTAGALAVWTADGSVLLVRSRTGEGLWGFPGGILHRREHALDGALRELHEETGVRTVTRHDLEIVDMHTQQQARHVEAVYRVHAPRPDTALSADRGGRFEIAEVAWWPVDALPPLRRESRFVLKLYPTVLGSG